MILNPPIFGGIFAQKKELPKELSFPYIIIFKERAYLNYFTDSGSDEIIPATSF